MRTYLCPACLTELPDDYPFDHVAFDRALRGDRDLFAAMDTTTRGEVVATGLARGLTLMHISRALNWPYNRLEELLAGDPGGERARQEELIRQLWEQDLNDTAIAERIAPLTASSVQKIRCRMGLPSKFGPRGRRRKAVPA